MLFSQWSNDLLILTRLLLGFDVPSAAVPNLFRLEDHLHILSPGHRQPLKIVPWKIAKIGLFVCLYPCQMKS